MDFGTPEYHDILPAACSGLCLASITALAFAVLMYLQPVSPSEPIIKQQRGAGSPSSSSCAEEQATCKRHIQYKDADGRIQQLQVDLAFPANSRTITRLMEAWWGCKGGRPPGSSKRAAAALAGTSKPRFKAMPVSFNNAVEKVMFLEAELLSALKPCRTRIQQLQVDLAFPANSRSITRLTEAWWGCK
eukprot:jgi/Sobl393_1/19797/SZX59710.1